MAVPAHRAKQNQRSYSIRQARSTDAENLYAFDEVSQHSHSRRKFIERTIQAECCFVIITEEQVIGYAVLEYSFYEEGFVSMLYIHRDYRKQGAGEFLMRYLEPLCKTSKLFASTNLSNQPMQSLFKKLGYVLSGVIHDLDEGDPELVYVKYLTAREVPKPGPDEPQ